LITFSFGSFSKALGRRRPLCGSRTQPVPGVREASGYDGILSNLARCAKNHWLNSSLRINITSNKLMDLGTAALRRYAASTGTLDRDGSGCRTNLSLSSDGASDTNLGGPRTPTARERARGCADCRDLPTRRLWKRLAHRVEHRRPRPRGPKIVRSSR